MDYDMNALMVWLGPAADELTAEQIERVAEADRDIQERYPDEDDEPVREAALSATVQYLLGDTSAEEAKRELAEARGRERRAYVHALQVAVMMVREARATGVGERLVDKKGKAEACGIDRMGLLRALGER